ncbi:MAG: gliding motility-associated C-terminal domain-containing protein [Burkholderiales bacterium]|nr:gliding motility-associated C-terminal domain-containing protein [Bacteroidia bacterium]
MKNGWLYFILVLLCSKTYSQINLVQNPSFEEISLCPNLQSQIKYANFWDTLKAGGGGTPDLYNSCDISNFVGVPYNSLSFQDAHSGVSYSGIITYYTIIPNGREYIQNKLFKKLEINKTYCVTAYVNLHNYSNCALDQIGICLDNGSIYAPFSSLVNNASPQITSQLGAFITDTLNWSKIQGLFMANGTEEYLTIGNFKSDIQTNTITIQSSNAYSAVYYFDDVSVIDANTKAYAGQDTLICSGDSVFIGRQPEVGLECEWLNNNTQIAQGAGIWVKPNISQQYIIQQDVCSILSYDTIQVTVKDMDCNPIVNTEIPNAFSPNGDGINDVWNISLGSGSALNGFEVYNRWGNLIAMASRASVTQINWDGRTTSGELCSDGIYFYVLKYTDANGTEQQLKGFISLFR